MYLSKIKIRCLYGLFLSIVLLLSSFSATHAQVSRSSYFDWGPYYSQNQVLGFSFSSLEELPAPTIPQDAIPQQTPGILPGNPLYFFERFAENIQLTLTTNPVQKEELRLGFAQERLAETKTLVEQGQTTLAQDSASDYKNAMEELAENVTSLAQKDVSGSADLVSKVESTAAANTALAQSLTLSSPPTITSVWSEVTDAAQTTMDAAADGKGEAPMPDELSTSIQTLKSQGMLTPEQSDKLYALTSRTQVREELDKLVSAGQFPLAEADILNQAVAKSYPDFYQDTQNVLRFAELRTYQAQPALTDEVIGQIQEWERQPDNIPPPFEIRPYLYYARAQELANNIDLSKFAQDQQTEVLKSYPDAAIQNPTYSPPPTPTPSPTPSSTPEGSPQPTSSPLPSPSPSPTPSPTEPYLTSYTGQLPGTPFYFFKQFGEGVSLITTFDPARKIELEMRYAEERLREANVLAQDKTKSSLYEDTLKKYQDSIGNVADDVKNFKGSEDDRHDLAKKLELEAARHNVIFEKGLLPQGEIDTKVYTAATEATEDALDKSADAQDKPTLPQALSNRLQDLKAQGIILPEEAASITDADSREEVRDKIRDLVKLGVFPPADAKKLDEGQSLVVPQDYNQLVEVRKIEELQRLRAAQTEFAQTATLRQTNAGYEQRINNLLASIDPTQIKPEDFAGREGLVKAYEAVVATGSVRPVNAGQFPRETPEPQDAVLTTCPVGAVFKQFEGCVWEYTGQRINDYEQYRCARPNEYWSFAAKECVLYDSPEGSPNDASPLCPVGYAWSWENQSCQTGTGGIILPSPSPEPSPSPDGTPRTCPTGATYRPPQGCVWDDTEKPIYDPDQYRCSSGNYFSFEKMECVPAPEPGSGYPADSQPTCPQDQIWRWGQGECRAPEVASDADYLTRGDIAAPKPTFVAPDSPFYFLKQVGEAVQTATAFTTQRRQETRLDQARERFAEGLYLLEKNDEKGFQKVLGTYTDIMQDVYNDMPNTEKLSETAQKALGEKLAKQAVEENLLLQKASVIATTDVAASIAAAVSITTQGVDRAADLKGEPAIPQDLKEKIEALPEEMLPADKKKEILEADTRVEARIAVGGLTSIGAINQFDTAVFDKDFTRVDPAAQTRLTELQRLNEIADLTTSKQDIEEKIEKTEDVAKKLDEFQKTFEVGQEIPAEIRPYIRLTRINEITQTIRPDIVRLEDFQNRKDIQLAVATLQQEFKPTSQDLRRVEEFRRLNPNRGLPPELARIEALSFSLGVREAAGPCFLPSPPFAPNTPCPATGAAIPIYSSTYTIGNVIFDEFRPGWPGGPTTLPTVDKDGNPLVYGKGPETVSAGNCPNGYHWMYDSGGWCMSNSGNYSSSIYSNIPRLIIDGAGYAPYDQIRPVDETGYTPYGQYYSAPGYPPTSYGYQGPGTYTGTYPYTPPNYYGVAPTQYTTNPPPGTVPGTGPQPTAPGQCPEGYHWMSDSGGWCMANGGAYTGGGGGYGGNVTPGTSCPPGSYWNSYSGSCQTPPGGGGGGSGGNCSSGLYWDGYRCLTIDSWGGIENLGGGGGTSGCYPPSGGCGSGWFDYGSCSCKAASSQGCYNVSASSCGSGFYWDSSACTCRSTGTPSTGGGTTSGSCPSGSHWMSDNGGYCMSDTGGGTSTPTGTTPTSGGGTSSGSCPSGYHWMSDNGGWCMSDGGGGTSTSTSTTTTTTTEPSPQPSTSTTTTTTEPVPAPSPAP